MRTAVVFLFILSLGSCTIQKRIYRPGWTIHWKDQKSKKIFQEDVNELTTESSDSAVPKLFNDSLIEPVYSTIGNEVVDLKSEVIEREKKKNLIERLEVKTYDFIQQNSTLEKEVTKQFGKDRPPINGIWFFLLSFAFLITGIAFISTADDENLLIGIGFIVGSIALIPIAIGFMIVRFKWISRHPQSRFVERKNRKKEEKSSRVNRRHQIAGRIILTLGILCLIVGAVLSTTAFETIGILLLFVSIQLILVGIIIGFVYRMASSKKKLE